MRSRAARRRLSAALRIGGGGLASISLSLQPAAALAAASAASDIFAHLSAAKLAAGAEFSGIATNLCLPDEPYIVRSSVARPQEPATEWYAAPYKVFDNLYWLGTRQHSSWALQTSDGIIIIDTNFAWAFEAEILNGMKTLGLDSAKVKYVLIGHAHGDHDQGAGPLQSRFGAKVVMGEEDWKSTLARPPSAPGGVPHKDISVGPSGASVTLGDTTVTAVATPGHTRGTLSFIFQVKDRGRPVTVAYSGGTATGLLGTSAARWDEYIASQAMFADMAKAAGATVILTNHSEFDGAYTKARLVAARREPGERNPFEVGADAVGRYFKVMIECAKASKLRVEAK